MVGLPVLHLALAVLSLSRENPTVDEVLHLPAGASYWQTGQFKLYHHNPPLVKLIAALPVLASGVTTEPLYRTDFWKANPPNKAGFGHEFARLNARTYFELFTRARLLMPLFALVGALAVFAWSRRLYGTGGGLLSLSLWCLCPNVLAHGRLITSDVPAAALGVAATYLFVRFLDRPGWTRALVAGLVLGLAELTKFSLLLLYVLWPLLALARLVLDRARADRSAWLAQVAGRGTVMVLLSLLIINLGYGFEGFATPLGGFTFHSRALTRDRAPVPPGPQLPIDLIREVRSIRINRFKATPLQGLPVPLPREYVLGFDDQKFETEGAPVRAFDRSAPADALTGYPVYLDGQLRDKGWWDYYLRALAYKVPEGTWLLVLLSLAVLAATKRPPVSWADEVALLALPVVVLVAMSAFTDINLGLRYVLPILPFLYVGAGKLVPWAAGKVGPKRWPAWGAIGVGVVATVAATLSIHPHYLAYFNLASGGPDRGSEHLIDSNLDWGQDLVGLKRWLDVNAPGERVGIAYFGQINPSIFAARGEPLDWFLPPPRPGTMRQIPPRYAGAEHPPGPGLYAVSASLVRGLPWRAYDSDRLAPHDAGQGAFSYFHRLKPIDDIGHSILIYRITPEHAAELAPLWDAGQSEVPGGTRRASAAS